MIARSIGWIVDVLQIFISGEYLAVIISRERGIACGMMIYERVTCQVYVVLKDWVVVVLLESDPLSHLLPFRETFRAIRSIINGM